MEFETLNNNLIHFKPPKHTSWTFIKGSNGTPWKLFQYKNGDNVFIDDFVSLEAAMETSKKYDEEENTNM